MLGESLDSIQLLFRGAGEESLNSIKFLLRAATEVSNIIDYPLTKLPYISLILFLSTVLLLPSVPNSSDRPIFEKRRAKDGHFF